MEHNPLHRKDRLILTTIEIIDELGIQGLSTREIARRQEVSEATLFRHYKSKNELLAAVLDYFSVFDQDIFQSIQLKDLKPKDAIRYLVRTYAEYYESYPAITSILQLTDVLGYEPELTEKVSNVMKSRRNFLLQLIDEAKSLSEISPEFDSGSIADIITGMMREVCIRWKMEGRNFLLKDTILSGLEILLKSIYLSM